VQIVLVAAFIVRLRAGQPFLTRVPITGATFFATGFILRRWAMRTMGARFRGYEVRRDDNGLATKGPYAVVRHPGYLGLMLMDVGLPLLLNLPRGLVPLSTVHGRRSEFGGNVTEFPDLKCSCHEACAGDGRLVIRRHVAKSESFVHALCRVHDR
jgi:hypothetical protein